MQGPRRGTGCCTDRIQNMQDMSREPQLRGLDRELAGETVRFLADRALWWPRARTLFVADVHLGKAESFRALGVPVPSGPTQATLERLTRLVRACSAAHLVVLGDLLHARAAHTDAVMKPFGDWRSAHASLRISLVRGNHDQHAGDPPAALGIEVVDAPHAMGPFDLCHDDSNAQATGHGTATGTPTATALAPGPSQARSGHRLEGHVHPAVRCAVRAGRSLRLPCFCIGPTRTLLPAFGDFTGTALIRAAGDESILAIADDTLVALPPGAVTQTGRAPSAARSPARPVTGR